MARYVARATIKRMVQNGIEVTKAKVGVLGITFKENCPDIRNSKVADLVKEFKTWGIQVVVADPWAEQDEVQHEYGLTLGTIDAQNPVDSLVVAVGHNEYRALSAQELKTYVRGNKPVIADVKCLFDRATLVDQGFTVFRL
jgi:UDP-N-acetyl-D-galactosamine dehydrogenase